ncbi:uncharacterized protein [Montipora capricornis]|uniref:uncharacterized protein n=1 Tax=Montipora capricornis TaxID=246305 RepID=UPI0035F1F3FE
MADRVEAFLRLNCQSPDNLSKFTVVELKEFLRQRDLNVSGSKNELCEKVFYAYKLAVPKSLCAKDEENIKRQTSENKLVVENGLIKLPPPDELKQGWQSGSANFPDTTDDEVDKYLMDAPKAILKGKSLESSGHVFNVEYHTISPNLKYCFVRGKCVPQE